jgi:hypothetical protein
MFVGKARASLRVKQFKCNSLGHVPGFSYKHKTKLKKTARDKHSSLLQKFINNGRKKFL